MDIFLSLLSGLLPLYIIIALGWLAGRFYGVERASLASLAIFILAPMVAFYYVSNLEFRLSYIAVPLVVYALLTIMSLSFYHIGKLVYHDKRANLLGMCAGATNTGYMGLPLAIMFLPPEWVGVYVFALTGGLFYEATILYYIANRGQFSPKESLKRVVQFPVLYAVLAGLLINAAGIEFPSQMDNFWQYFKGAYVVVGMMIIGVSLSRVSKLVMGPRFLSLVFLAQFVVWPLLAVGVITLDKMFIHAFVPEIYKILMIVAIVPPAANIAAFAAKLDLSPEKAATTVLLGTIFALFYIPAVLVLSGMY